MYRKICSKRHIVQIHPGISEELAQRLKADLYYGRPDIQAPRELMVLDNAVYMLFDDDMIFLTGAFCYAVYFNHLLHAENIHRVNVPYHQFVEWVKTSSFAVAEGCSRSDFAINIDSAQKEKNRQHLKLLVNTPVSELLQTGAVSYRDIGAVKRAQEELGIYFTNHSKSYIEVGKYLELSFVGGQTVRIEVPPRLSYVEDRPLAEASGGGQDTGGVIVARDHPFFQHLLERSKAYKKRHWWIYSRQPDAGKTTALKFIKQKCYAFEGKRSNGFWHEFDPNSQFILFDEYGNSGESVLPIGELNLICDGNYSFNKKYRNAQKLNSDLPIVIIFSNLHPKDVYTESSGAAALPLLYARFSIVQLMSCPAGQKNPGSGNRSPDPSSPATPVLRSRHSASSQHPLPETEAVAQADEEEEEAAQAEEEEAAQADEEGKRTTEEGGSGEAEDGGWLGGRGGKSTKQ